VALNKRKVLDAAQKYLQKGNLDRALKEYSKVLEADPRDTNVRLKVGDVQLRRGRSEEALEAYLEVAQQFMNNGFDAKAVALFKQITKIDEKRYDIYEPLAELYQRLGLVSEAMGALQTAAEAHQREGRKKEGLTLLRKMASLDPSNTSTRLKIAELLWKEGLQEDSLAEYDEVVAELGRQGDHEGEVRVHEEVLRELPERLENLIGLGVAHLESRHPESAEPPLLKATEVSVESVEAWEALARVHEALGRMKELEDTWKTVAAIYKDRGDEDRAKEILQLYVTPEGIGSDEDEESAPLDTSASDPLESIDGGDTLGDLAGQTGGDLDLDIGDGASMNAAPEPVAAAPEPVAAAPEPDLEDEIEIELDEEVVEEEIDAGDTTGANETTGAQGATRAQEASGDAEADDAEADPAQLLAEAGVYQRYSQYEKAVACLERILETEPNHLSALEKLGETRHAMGDGAEAVLLWKRGASEALSRGDRAAFGQLCDRLRGVDEAAAEELAADALTATLHDEPEPELDVDLELAFDTPSGEPELTGAFEKPALDVDVEDLLHESEQETDAVESEPPFIDDEPSLADEASGAPESSETVDAADRDGSDFEVKTGGVTLGAPSNTEEVSAEDLEEAEFYYRQGLLDEAEQILRRLLTVAPGHPQVLLRLGEIAKSRGECPSSPVAEGLDFDSTEEETQPGVGTSARGEDHLPDDDTLSDSTLEDLDALPDLDEAAAGPDDETMQADLSDALPETDDGLDDDTGSVTLGGDTTPDPLPAPAVVPPAAADAELSGGGFDLAAELSDVFDDSHGGVSGDLTVGGTTQAGFEAIFQSFKQGVKETLGEGEHETHYDLGIAYREMGLLEDAIGEFRVAMTASSRKLECLAMMGLCALDLGRADDAVSHLEQALALPDLADDTIAGLRFDLGRAFEQKGDLERARSTWQQVAAFDPEFQDVQEHLDQLGQEESSPSLGELEPDDLSGSGEALESFDDLIAEAEAGFDDDDDNDDDDDDPEGGDDRPEGSGDDSESDMGSTQWGRKVSYG
jgi:tetratricopeptide (TPR) repeat protein